MITQPRDLLQTATVYFTFDMDMPALVSHTKHTIFFFCTICIIEHDLGSVHSIQIALENDDRVKQKLNFIVYPYGFHIWMRGLSLYVLWVLFYVPVYVYAIPEFKKNTIKCSEFRIVQSKLIGSQVLLFEIGFIRNSI